MVLFAATAIALVWVNSPAGDSYTALWETRLGLDAAGLRMDARHWVNDAVMTVFFLVIGLEIKHELVAGQLAHLRQAVVPALAAVGGAVVPARPPLARRPRRVATPCKSTGRSSRCPATLPTRR
jgi:NhaA family Na+:H+ antiporter